MSGDKLDRQVKSDAWIACINGIERKQTETPGDLALSRGAGMATADRKETGQLDDLEE